MKQYFTDGAATMKKIDGEYVRCAGGWAFARIEDGKVLYSASEGIKQTTNNFCELSAIRAALQDFSKSVTGNEFGETVEIHSDSAYSINVLTNWAFSWEKNGWTRGKKHEPIENLEIIKDTFYLIKSINDIGHTVKFVKVKGHDTNEFNNYVDKLAVEAKLSIGED